MGVFLAAIAPVFIIAFYIYFRDKYEKEPLLMLAKALALGMIAVIPILFVERFLMSVMPDMGRVGNAAYQAFVVAGGTEEFFKYLALYLLIWKSPHFNEQFDGIVYAVFVSLGIGRTVYTDESYREMIATQLQEKSDVVKMLHYHAMDPEKEDDYSGLSNR